MGEENASLSFKVVVGSGVNLDAIQEAYEIWKDARVTEHFRMSPDPNARHLFECIEYESDICKGLVFSWLEVSLTMVPYWLLLTT